MGLKSRLNITYAAVQAIFWVVCCPIAGFGSAHLLAVGFSSVDVGIMLGLANVLAVVVQPLLSERADADERFSPIRIVAVLTVAMLASSAAQAALMPGGPVMAVLWTFSATCSISANVFVTAVKYQLDQDRSIDFGACRAVGSLAWAATSSSLGFAVERFGIRIVPLAVCAAAIAFLALLGACELDVRRRGMRGFHEAVETAGAASSWPEFIRENRWLMLLLLGIGLVYLHHALGSYFSIVIVENVGGDESDMGLIIALAALLEIPGMVLFSHIEKRLDAGSVLLFSLAMFACKAIAIWAASTVLQLTFAYSFQLFSYGLFTTSSVSFAARVTRPSDLVKAQACFSLVTTASAVFSSFVGGALFQMLGVRSTLLTAAVSACVGLAIVLVSLPRIASSRERRGWVAEALH